MKTFIKKRMMPWLLSAAMIASITGTPIYAFGAEIPCTHEHTEECYIEVEKCVHKHTAECYPDADEDDDMATPADAKAEEATECPHICDEESGCITKVLDCQHEHMENGGADPTESKGAGADNSLMQKITAWEWIDENEYLVDGELVLSDVNEDNPADFDTVVSMLPEKISAAIEDEDEPEEITLDGWECADYETDADGNWPASGKFTFQAELPEGYVLSGTKALRVPVTLTGEEPELASMTLVEQWKRLNQRNARGGDYTLHIYNEAQLLELAELVNSEEKADSVFRTADYKLEGDIDLSGVENWTPIGTYDSDDILFMGTFDGGGHVISNLTVNHEEDDYQGLFGFISGGTIKNLGLEDVAVSGNAYVGGIAGYANYASIENCYVRNCDVRSAGTDDSQSSYAGGVVGSNFLSSVINCYVTGAVTGDGDYVGGVAGYAYGCDEVTSVTNCYAVASVSGDEYVGGMAGYVYYGSVTHCYAAGTVSGTGERVGGVAGSADYSSIKNCAALNSSVNAGVSGYANRVVVPGVGDESQNEISDNYAWSGMEVNGTAVTGSAADNLNGADLVYDSGTGEFATSFWAIFAGAESAWDGLEDAMSLPTLANVPNPELQSSEVPYYIQIAENDELTISTVAELEKFRDDVNNGNDYKAKKVRLAADIDLSGVEWEPIGSYDDGSEEGKPFAGTFDGDSHVISNLTIDGGEKNYQGLFGYLTGTVQKLGMENVTVSGNEIVGGIAGCVDTAEGSITNSYVTGTVTGSNDVGGVAARIKGGSVTNCYVTGTVTGDVCDVGGVAGYVWGGSVTNCYAASSVSAPYGAGGVAGFLEKGRVSNCYAVGTVTGRSERLAHTGGVAGYIQDGSSVTNCAALNASAVGKDAHRVVGKIMEDSSYLLPSTTSGNYAWTGMKVNSVAVTDGEADSLDGANLAYASETGFAPTFSEIFSSEASGWDSFTDGTYLPILADVANPELQSSEVPAYIRADVDDDFSTISTVAELEAFREAVNSGIDYADKTVILTADIDLTGGDWTPIGANGNLFAGTFDGSGHTISNLTSSDSNYLGLFGHVTGTVRNLGLENVNISGA